MTFGQIAFAVPILIILASFLLKKEIRQDAIYVSFVGSPLLWGFIALAIRIMGDEAMTWGKILAPFYTFAMVGLVYMSICFVRIYRNETRKPDNEVSHMT